MKRKGEAARDATKTSADCAIEDWRWFVSDGWLTIEGTTACPDGHIVVRAYSAKGDEREYVGNGSSYISGYTFDVAIHEVADDITELSIRYTVEPEDD